MSDRPLTTLRAFAWPGYFAALLLVAFPLADLVTNVWPLQLGNVQWRYGGLGLLSGFFLTPVLGMLLAVGVAILLEHRVVLRGLSLANLLGGVLLAGSVVLFGLDWLQMRPTMSDEARRAMDIGSLKALVKFAAAALLVGWMGVVGFRASRRRSHRAPGKLVREPPPAA